MSGDEQQLSNWREIPGPGHDWIEIGHRQYRPARLEAVFTLQGHRFEVAAESDQDGVRITQVSWAPGEADRDPADALSRFDVAAAAAALERAAVISYLPGGFIRFGGDAPFLWVPNVRRYLAGPEGAPRPGPKPKASLDQVAKTWRAATRKGTSPSRAIADALDVSVSTAHRYIASARKAGLIKEDSR